jgi:hypothetical protein
VITHPDVLGPHRLCSRWRFLRYVHSLFIIPCQARYPWWPLQLSNNVICLLKLVIHVRTLIHVKQVQKNIHTLLHLFLHEILVFSPPFRRNVLTNLAASAKTESLNMWLSVIYGAFGNKNAISAASSSGNQNALGPRDFEFGFGFTPSSDEGGLFDERERVCMVMGGK